MAKVLNKANKDYSASLIPENVPDWKKVWQEGYEIGKNLKIKTIPFEKKYGMKPVDYRMKLKKEGKLFHSTKGEGHGFGLVRMDAIVERLDGYISRNSEDGAFTTEILLPQI